MYSFSSFGVLTTKQRATGSCNSGFSHPDLQLLPA